jgi:hypothetical protein
MTKIEIPMTKIEDSGWHSFEPSIEFALHIGEFSVQELDHGIAACCTRPEWPRRRATDQPAVCPARSALSVVQPPRK